ncbi:(2Fe-2S)-binding protein [uncultured Piscinibacter sp.]|uniref:(2Fe-2S)-binding protein n=1 Tax=uncultured Piscinibacter sp. TaxID=1131835 RepID=UPI00262C1F29|nr:(2Fe-2S)-binding protein [uncultured Piscinibacter sp.]
MIVCVCHRVSDRDIAREARSGCADFESLQDELRIGTACGACLEQAQEAFAAHAGDCPSCPGARRCGSVPLAAAA